MGQTKTKMMVQGAMIAAIFGALSLINTYTGSLFDIFICYGMVVPIVWYGYTYDLKHNFIVCIVSMLVIAMMGLPFFVISSISSCFIGLFIGESLKRKAKKETILLGTFVVTFINNIMIYEVFAQLLQIDLVSEMTVTYQEMVKLLPTISQTITLDMILSFIPLILIIMSVMEMYVIVLICQLVLSRLKIEFSGSSHIAMMHLSQKTGIVIAIVMFGSYILQRFVGVDSIYLTYLYMLATLSFGLQGLSFVCFYLIIKQKQKFMMLVFLAIFLPYVGSLYVVIGILDIFSDLRKNILYNKNNNE